MISDFFVREKQSWATGVFGLLSSTASERREACFIEDLHGTGLSYGEVEDRARRFAAYLRDRGIGRGDRVAIHVRNRAEVAIALFGTALVGGIFCVLNSKLRPRGLAAILEQAEPSLVVLDTTTASNFQEVMAMAEGAHQIPSVIVGEDSWREAMDHEPWQNDWPGCDVDAACLVFTSGSTGVPRGVTLSHDNITFVVAAIQARLGYRPEDVIGVFLPLAFDYGLYQIFIAAIAGSGLYIGDPDQVGPRLPRLLREQGVSVLPGVPSVFAALLTLARRSPLELPSLRAVTNTGERLPVAVIEKLKELFPSLEIFPMYGLTECKRVSILRSDELATHLDTVGRALDGTEVYTVDVEGRRLSPGETGELVVRGRHVALGYWRAPEETARRFRKRAPESAVELFTGDSCAVDADGYIRFVSRDGDWIKHRGHRIGPAEIEAEACRLVGVANAALLQRESDDTLHLFVEAAEGVLTEGDLLRALDAVLEPAKVPDVIHILASMPKSMNGKIDRKTLAAQLVD